MKSALLILGTGFVLAIVASTQWLGYRLPIPTAHAQFAVGKVTFFGPWQAVAWYRAFGMQYSTYFDEALFVAAFILVGTAATYVRVRDANPAVKPVGRNRWATRHDMQRAGLHAPAGIVVGKHRGRVLRYDKAAHVLVAGATRSGKGVGHVIPTLLSWTGSALVLDVKRELWQITAGYRRSFSHCFFFDPTSLHSARFNPLLEVRKGQNEIRDVQIIVEILSNPEGDREEDAVWTQSASMLLTAVILHVLYIEPDDKKNLATVRARILDIDRTLQDMQELPHRINPETSEPEVHPEIARVAREIQTQAPKFAAGVRATAAGWLEIFADDILCRNTAVSDFAISDLVCSACPTTLYLQPPPSDIPRLRPLLRLIIRQICQALLEELHTDNRGRPKRHELLLQLDEFTALGRLSFLSNALRQTAGYHIRAQIVVQSLQDIAEVYGPQSTLLDNMHIIAAFNSSDPTSLRKLSELTGTTTEYRASYSRKRRWTEFGSGGISQAEHIRPLLQPGEIRELPANEQLLFVTGHPPMRIERIQYFADAAFRKKATAPPDQQRYLDVPRALEVDAMNGLPHDWRGERCKGPRMIIEAAISEDEDDWSPPPLPPNVDDKNDDGKDDYTL